MANMLVDGASFLSTQLSAYASQTVTYSRGGYSVSIAATKCPVQPESDQEINEEIRNCDWIVKASLLVLNGVAVEPGEKDVITEVDGQRWRVLALPNEHAFRQLDQFGYAFRIHTKRTDEAN